jgi:mono/diheme cytochrome c family protein
MKRLMRLTVALLSIIGLIAIAVALAFASGGISARPAPSRSETVVARRLRAFAIPRSVTQLTNPVAATPQAVRDGMAHFADHCAVCHANDGSGNTEMGRGLYPRAPDMRLAATQSLSDGSLFYIIENGVRLTGMPAWGDGTPDSEAASWRLVLFIRHLPTLSDTELDEMKTLNPKTPVEWREQEEARQFLEGAGAQPKPAAPHSHGGRK